MTNAGKGSKVLLTGFGPFPGVPVNASARLVEDLRTFAGAALPTVEIVAEVLPTCWNEATARLENLLQAHAPALALHFGVSGEASGLTIETQARNAVCAGHDVNGALPALTSLDACAPKRLPVTIDADAVIAQLRARGLAADLSDDAGDYICNAVLFRALRLAGAQSPSPQVGFIHIPDSLIDAMPTSAGRCIAAHPEPARKAQSSALTWEDALQGGTTIIATCLDAPKSRGLVGIRPRTT